MHRDICNIGGINPPRSYGHGVKRQNCRSSSYALELLRKYSSASCLRAHIVAPGNHDGVASADNRMDPSMVRITTLRRDPRGWTSLCGIPCGHAESCPCSAVAKYWNCGTCQRGRNGSTPLTAGNGQMTCKLTASASEEAMQHYYISNQHLRRPCSSSRCIAEPTSPCLAEVLFLA